MLVLLGLRRETTDLIFRGIRTTERVIGMRWLRKLYICARTLSQAGRCPNFERGSYLELGGTKGLIRPF